MNLEEYLKGTKASIATTMPQKGSKGKETDWLYFCELNLRSGKLLVVDPSYGPKPDQGLLVDLPTGKYVIQARVLNYGPVRYVSRLRVLIQESTPTVGKSIGTVGNDTAQIGVCDHEVFSEAWGDDDDASLEKIQNTLWDAEEHGVAVLDEENGAVMPFVSSGFGDGEYHVHELLSDGKLAGVEVEFIKAETEYPEYTPGAVLYT